MTKWALRFGRFAVLIAITVFAIGVMWWVSQPLDETDLLADAGRVAAPPPAATPSAPVEVTTIAPAWSDVTLRYSGKIEPWETYTLGFEAAGRVAELGRNALGEPLNDGDRVEAGQVLARIDDRILLARRDEASAQYELAAANLERSRRARQRTPGAVTEADYQAEVATLAQAKAMQQIALKNLEDTVLNAPVAGSIVRRMIEPGESVGANDTVFELVENDRLRLVVNVPEARVRELEMRRRAVHAVAAGERPGIDPEDGVFRAHVRLEADDVYGEPWPPIEAEVYRIAEVADQATGMFEVEVLIPNGEGLLRPGMVATAEIVTDRVFAYALPEAAVLFREGKTYAFALEPERADLKVMFWDLGPTEVWRSRRLELTRWVDQGETVLLPAEGAEPRTVVTRGHQRLRDGQLVRVVGQGPPAEERVADLPGAG